MKRLTLTNSFHGTSVGVLVPDWVETQAEAWRRIQTQARCRNGVQAQRTAARIRRALCGTRGCTCGVVRPGLGER
jgi:hypothetical protein